MGHTPFSPLRDRPHSPRYVCRGSARWGINENNAKLGFCKKVSMHARAPVTRPMLYNYTNVDDYCKIRIVLTRMTFWPF